MTVQNVAQQLSGTLPNSAQESRMGAHSIARKHACRNRALKNKHTNPGIPGMHHVVFTAMCVCVPWFCVSTSCFTSAHATSFDEMLFCFVLGNVMVAPWDYLRNQIGASD